MFVHEFREDFVLALKLLFQEGDPSLVGVSGASGAGLECGSGVLEELLLPAVEHRGVDSVSVTQIRDRGALEKVETQNGNLLLSREALSDFLGHGKPPLEIVAYSSERFVPFRLKQNNSGLEASVTWRHNVREDRRAFQLRSGQSRRRGLTAIPFNEA
jgi:hypothetical protein